MNKVYITGRITKDIELKGNENKFLTNTIAVYGGKDKDNNDISYFFDFKAFNYNANKLNAHATKGSKIVIEGDLRQDKWEKDGTNYSKVVIYVEQVEIMTAQEENTPQNIKEKVKGVADSKKIDDSSDLPF